MILTACQSTPDSVEKDGVVIVKESAETKESESILKDSESVSTDFKETVPENYKDEWKTENDRLSFDAEIIVPDSEITKGFIEEIPVDEDLIRKVLLKEDENEIIESEDVSGRHLDVQDNKNETTSLLGIKYSCIFNDESGNFYFYDYIKEGPYYAGDYIGIDIHAMTDEDKEVQVSYESQLTQLLTSININKGIQKTTLKKKDDGSYDGDISGSTIINGTVSYPAYYYALDGITYLNDSLYAQVNAEGVYILGNTKNYEAASSEKAELLPFETIIASAKQLFEKQLISNTGFTDEKASDLPVSRIQLTYILKNSGNEIIYTPVWVFEKYRDVYFGYLPLFIIDAQTGDLELYSDAGF